MVDWRCLDADGEEEVVAGVVVGGHDEYAGGHCLYSFHDVHRSALQHILY
jgi:hypothetical protein